MLLGVSVAEAGDHARGIKLLEEVVSRSTKVAGKDDVQTLLAIGRLAAVKVRTGGAGEAVTLLNDAITAGKSKTGKLPESLETLTLELVRALGLSGRSNEAAKVAAEDRAAAAALFQVLTAGAPPAAVTIERLEQGLGWTVTQLYGLTETASGTHVNRPEGF